MWVGESIFYTLLNHPASCSTPLRHLRFWRRYWSSDLAIIVAEQATEALPPYDWTTLTTNFPLPRNQLVIETLMIGWCPISIAQLGKSAIPSRTTRGPRGQRPLLGCAAATRPLSGERGGSEQANKSCKSPS